MRTLYLCLFFTVILFTACEKVVDADKLLDTEEKVLIISYISPIDTLLRVKVSRALPSIGTILSTDDSTNRQRFLIKDAVVNMSDNEGSTVEFSYSDEEETYISDAANLSILEGQQYFLNVVANGRTFSATCTIPKQAPEIVENVQVSTNESSGSTAEINVTFTDIPGERNYYILSGLTENSFDGQTYISPLFFESDGLLTDAIEDGIILGETTRVYLGQQGDTQSKEITLQVAHVDEIIFKNIQASNLNRDNDGNPFVEYSISPNNIEGENVVGLFAGFQVTQKVIMVRQ